MRVHLVESANKKLKVDEIIVDVLDVRQCDNRASVCHHIFPSSFSRDAVMESLLVAVISAKFPVLMRDETVGHARGITRSSEWYNIEHGIKSLVPS